MEQTHPMHSTVGEHTVQTCQDGSRDDEGSIAFDKLWGALAPYLSADTAEFILSSAESKVQLHAKRQEMTVLFADIRGFTSLAEQMEPEDCVKMLNSYFCLAVDEIVECGGTVDKFQGDCVMATFCNVPGWPDHGLRAVKCAIRLREAVLSLRIPQLPRHRIRLGIGVNTGVAMVARLGSNKRMDYTAIGDCVNVAHRLQSLSKPDQILISEHTQRRIGGDLNVEAIGRLRLRGRTEPIGAYAVHDRLSWTERLSDFKQEA